MCKVLTFIIVLSCFVLIVDGNPVYTYRYNGLNQSLKKWLSYNPDVSVDDVSIFLANWVENGQTSVDEQDYTITGKRTTNQKLLDYLSSRTIALPRIKQVDQPQLIRLLPHQFGTMMG